MNTRIRQLFPGGDGVQVVSARRGRTAALMHSCILDPKAKMLGQSQKVHASAI
jgi:hypothetical protein